MPGDVLPLPAARRRIVTAGVITGTFLAALEATVVGTAMPTIVTALGGLARYGWVFSAYLLASTVTVPLWGKLADLYGRRAPYQAAIALFLAGSALCGAAQSLDQLVACRFLQGLGAGGLVPLALTIIGDLYSLRERARMQAMFSGVWGLASIFGPLAGGFITDQFHWRWVFFINVPFGIVAAVMVGIALAEPKPARRPQLDIAGAVLFTAAVSLLLAALVDERLAAGRPGARAALLLGSAALCSWAFLRRERRAPEPLVPLALFESRVVSVAVAAGFLAGASMFGALTYIPLFAQGVRGATATEAGSMLTPLMLSWVAVSIAGGRLLLRFGARPMVLLGLAMLTASFAIFASFGAATTRLVLYADLVLMGAGLGFTMFTLLIAVQQAVTRERLGTATSLNQFARAIGGTVGVALMGAIVAAGLANGGAAEGAALAVSQLAAHRDALAPALQRVFLLCAVASAAAFVAALRLPRGKAEDLAPSSGEVMVMAEMTSIDPDNEPG